MTATIVEIFWIVFPVFGLIGIGVGVAASGYLSESVGEGLGDFVFLVAIPVLLFRTLATAGLPDASPWPLWFSYFGGLSLAWVLSDILIRKLFRRDAKAGIIAGVSAGFSNAVLFGLPLIFTAVGENGAVPLTLIIGLQLPVLMTVSTILIARAEHQEGSPDDTLSPLRIARQIVSNLVRNPLIIALVVGALWRLANLPYAGPVEVLGDKIAAVAVPCALIALGMSLTKYGIRGHIAPAMIITVLKLVLMPALVWFLSAKVFAMPPVWVAVATLIAACPTGVNAWLIANRFRTGHAISANSITISAVMSVFTLSGWLWVLGF